jgi:hypothetical protein
MRLFSVFGCLMLLTRIALAADLISTFRSHNATLFAAIEADPNLHGLFASSDVN